MRLILKSRSLLQSPERKQVKDSMSSRAPSMEQELHRGRDSLVTEQVPGRERSDSHLAGGVVADDLLVQADADDQQVVGGREGQAGAWGLVGAVEHVQLLLGVGVPQHHRSAVRHAAQQGALHRGQPQVVDGLESNRSSSSNTKPSSAVF